MAHAEIQQRVEIKALTGIRIVAALWVVFFHFRQEYFHLLPDESLLKTVVSLGHFAVPLFFILSGFILSHAYFHRYSIRDHHKFIALRFARLWPVHLATLVALVVLVLFLALRRGHFGSDSGYPFIAIPAELAMLRCWFSSDLLWNFPAWSIHAEWFAYIFIFPIAFLAFRRLHNIAALILSLGILLGTQFWLEGLVIPGKCDDITLLFLSGSALYQLRTLSSKRNGHVATYCGIVVFFIAALSPGAAESLLFHIAFILIVFGLSFSGGPINWLLSTKPLVYGGTISYSLYMSHEIVHKLHSTLSSLLTKAGAHLSWMHLTALILTSLLVASALYHLVEHPANARIRRIAGEF